MMISQYRGRGNYPLAMALFKSAEPNTCTGKVMQASKPWAGRPEMVTDYINTDRGLQSAKRGRPLNLDKKGDIYGITNRYS